MECNMSIDEYLEKPYWVIDILPKQVPANSQGQYFKIEDFFLKEPQIGVVLRKFCSLLIKLNCYYDIAVLNANRWLVNPLPESIEKWLSSREAVYVVIKSEETMIGFNGDDHYMTLYNPNEKLLELICSLANSEGLFVWKPENQDTR